VNVLSQFDFLGSTVDVVVHIAGALIVMALTVVAVRGAPLHRGLVRIVFALVVLLLVGLVAAALILATFGLSLLAFAILFIYTLPAVAIGGRGATDAVVESIGLSTRTLRDVWGPALLVIAAATAGGLLSDAVGWIAMCAAAIYAAVRAAKIYQAIHTPPAKDPT
jgi:hypothetical protein